MFVFFSFRYTAAGVQEFRIQHYFRIDGHFRMAIKKYWREVYWTFVYLYFIERGILLVRHFLAFGGSQWPSNPLRVPRLYIYVLKNILHTANQKQFTYPDIMLKYIASSEALVLFTWKKVVSCICAAASRFLYFFLLFTMRSLYSFLYSVHVSFVQRLLSYC